MLFSKMGGIKVKFKLVIILLIIISCATAFIVLDIGGLKDTSIQPVNREDLPEDMPEDFNFILNYGYKPVNELNTFTNEYTKDLIQEGTIKTELVLSNEEKEIIYIKMREMNIETFPENLTNGPIEFDPSMTYSLTIQANGNQFTITFNHWNHDEDEMALKFMEVGNMIKTIIEEREEYKNLPDAEGGYL